MDDRFSSLFLHRYSGKEEEGESLRPLGTKENNCVKYLQRWRDSDAVTNRFSCIEKEKRFHVLDDGWEKEFLPVSLPGKDRCLFLFFFF